MNVTIRGAAELLLRHDNIVILAHHKPDGDTLGSSFGLLYALEQLGKTARVECADGYPEKFAFLFGDYVPKEFTAAFVVAADVADISLLGDKAEKYPQVDLCIDHHKSNALFAVNTLLDPISPATAQIIYGVITTMGARPDKAIANALFTGLSTDTGCFKFSNVTPAAHRLAAELIDCGAEHGMINKVMFDTKTPGRLEVERLMTDNLRYHFDGRCAVVALEADIKERFHVTEEDLDGIAAFPRRIQGVLAGVVIRTQEDSSYRISLRTEDPIDASRVCMRFGGGGHARAAGCTLTGNFDEIHAKLLSAIADELKLNGL